MKSAIVAAAILGLTASGSFAAETSVAPLELTDAQMDGVTAGQGCTLVSCIDVNIEVQNNEIVKNVQVAATAAVAVLGRAVAGQGVRFNPPQ
jgi:hypothetical protein